MNWVNFDGYWYNLDMYETVYVDTYFLDDIPIHCINGRSAFEKDKDGENLIHTLSDEYNTKDEAEKLLEHVMSKFN